MLERLDIFNSLLNKHDDSRVKINLLLAKEAIAYAKNKIKLSAADFSVTIQEQRARQQPITSMRRYRIMSDYESLYELLSIHHRCNIFKIKHIMRAIKETGYGNCIEFAVCVQNYLMKHNISSESIHNATGDHIYVVLDRDPKSNCSDPRTWGKQAIIIDSFNDEPFHINDIDTKLKNYVFNEDNLYPNSSSPFTFTELLYLRYDTSTLSTFSSSKLIQECLDKIEIINTAFYMAFENQYDSAVIQVRKKLLALWRDSLNIKTQKHEWIAYDLERRLNRVLREAMKAIKQYNHDLESGHFKHWLLEGIVTYYETKYKSKDDLAIRIYCTNYRLRFFEKNQHDSWGYFSDAIEHGIKQRLNK